MASLKIQSIIRNPIKSKNVFMLVKWHLRFIIKAEFMNIINKIFHCYKRANDLFLEMVMHNLSRKKLWYACYLNK